MQPTWKQVLLASMLGLSLVGCGGSSSNDPVTPPTQSTIQKQVSALILTATGNTINNAKIKIAGQTFSTDVLGQASFSVNIPQNAQYVVVQIEKAGFVSQALRIKASELANISASLLMVKNLIEVAAIEQAQIIESSELNASISIPANAFVRPNGQLATGKVVVEFTPWDIQSSDLNAMPANGVAQNNQNHIVDLISAGMISATFKNQQGEILQLARGKSADLMMDLLIENIANQEMTVGTEIPMWYFDEAKGLWLEEGTGHVVESVQSSTGLAVHASVSHFSTWNWDLEFENDGSLLVQCMTEGQALPCHAVAEIRLNDGSRVTKYSHIPVSGLEVVNIPTQASIAWKAYGVQNGLIGQAQSSTDTPVIIELQVPTTKNNVSCELADGTATSCQGLLNNQIPFTIGVPSTQVVSTLVNHQNLQWQAKTPLMWKNNQWVRYRGTQVSDASENVVIKLTELETLADTLGLDFYAECKAYAVGEDLTGQPCELTVEIENADREWNRLVYQIPFGVRTKIELPEPYTGFEVYDQGPIHSINLFASMLNGRYCDTMFGSYGFERHSGMSFIMELAPSRIDEGIDADEGCITTPT